LTWIESVYNLLLGHTSIIESGKVIPKLRDCKVFL
jgi:hypothetical protein